MRFFFSIFLLAFCTSCSSVSLEEDPIVRKHFSDADIEYLNSILTFFDSEVISQTPNSNEVVDSYNELFKVTQDSIVVENYNAPFLDINGRKLELLLSELPNNLKTEIWYEASSIDPLSNDTTKYIDIRHDGDYADFLQSASQKNDFIARYHDDLIHAFAISPSMNANMIVNSNKLNFRKERERLIYAIHFISLQKLPSFNN